ncbi:hypothetical protein BJ170DRAFT_603697 [Xylariales sp. AK1849]|nr:hypothetical protein BJ170DRAFT_603697 [Xylariales sp. AK1849]
MLSGFRKYRRMHFTVNKAATLYLYILLKRISDQILASTLPSTGETGELFITVPSPTINSLLPSTSSSVSPHISPDISPELSPFQNEPREQINPRKRSPSADPEMALKRQRNNVAARRYRQKKIDRISELELELKDVKEDRDDLRIRLARQEVETATLRSLLKMKAGIEI